MVLTVFILSVKLHKTKKKQTGGYIGYGQADRLGQNKFIIRSKSRLMKLFYGTTAPMTTTPDIEGILDSDDSGMYLTILCLNISYKLLVFDSTFNPLLNSTINQILTLYMMSNWWCDAIAFWQRNEKE